MKKVACLVTLALASSVSGLARAGSNFEYNNPSPFDATKPAQPSLAQIHLTKDLHNSFKAYIAYPGSKTKVIVAILDGLADTRQVDLTGHETNVIAYGGVYAKYDNHGTHVSGIAGGAQNDIGIVGVNPFSTLVNIPVFDQFGWVATDLGKKALDKAASLGARVANMSYGPTTRGDVFMNGELSLFRNYNSTIGGRGIVLVRAAGNDGANALNESFSGDAATALSNLLIVGSVGPNNSISSFSNRPGGACIGGTKTVCTSSDTNAMMKFWLMAPGENILSDLPNNYIGTMSGTSMATPHVTGAASLVFQKALAGNTLLTPGQVAQILKLSADDLGVPGVDAVYGWGLLDVAAALNPIGTTYFPTGSTVNSGLVVTQGSGVSSSSLVGGRAIEGAVSGILALDDFKRGFIVDAPNLFSPAPAPTTNFVQDFAAEVSSLTTEIHPGDQSTLSFTSSGDVGSGGMRVISFDNSNLHLDTGLVVSASYFTTAQVSAPSQRASFGRRMAQEFYAGSREVAHSFDRAMFLGWDMKTSSRLTLSGLYLRTAPIADIANVPDNVAAKILDRRDLNSSLVKLGANYRLSDYASAGIYAGYLGEQGRTLGMETAGAFSLGDAATYISGVNLSADLGNATTLSAFAEQSTTINAAARNSIFAADQWRGSKYGASLTQSDPFGLRGLVQMKLVRAWQIDSGSLRVHLPVGRELDGTVNYEDRVVSVAHGGTPLEFDLSYLGGSGNLKYGAGLRMRDDGAGAPDGEPQASLATSVHWSF